MCPVSDCDSSFEAGQLAALFKPKLTSDPNRRGADMLLRSLSSRRAGQGGSTRARLARIVSRDPEVMVKVTGRPTGKNHAAAHFDYIGRKGDVPLETRDGDILTDQEDRAALARAWGETGRASCRARGCQPCGSRWAPSHCKKKRDD